MIESTPKNPPVHKACVITGTPSGLGRARLRDRVAAETRSCLLPPPMRWHTTTMAKVPAAATEAGSATRLWPVSEELTGTRYP